MTPFRVLHVLDYAAPFPGSMIPHLEVLGRTLRNEGGGLVASFPRDQDWFERLNASAEVFALPQIQRPIRTRFATALRGLIAMTGADLVHLHFSYAMAIALALSRRTPVPVIYHWHSPPLPLLDRSLRDSGRRVPPRGIGRLLARLGDRALARHICVSTAIRRELIAHRWLDADRVQVVPGAVEVPVPREVPLHRGEAAVSPGRAGDAAPRVGAVMNFRPQKDHATLLRALALLSRSFPALRLVLIGDGPTRQDTERLAADLGLTDRVEFTGFLSDLESFYASLDVAVLSAWYEGQGLVVLEAMARGVPVVASRLPAVEEAVRDGIDGVLVPPGDPDALAAAIQRLLEDQGLRDRLRASARQKAAREHTLEIWSRRIVEVYEDVLRTWSRSPAPRRGLPPGKGPGGRSG